LLLGATAQTAVGFALLVPALAPQLPHRLTDLIAAGLLPFVTRLGIASSHSLGTGHLGAMAFRSLVTQLAAGGGDLAP
jgi:hypothetical protein